MSDNPGGAGGADAEPVRQNNGPGRVRRRGFPSEVTLLAGLARIYKRYQGQYTRSITAVTLAVTLAAVCYFVFKLLDSYVHTDEEKSMNVMNANDSWAFARNYPDEMAPVYREGDVVTTEARDRLRGDGVEKWTFRAASPVQFALYIHYGVPAVLFALGGAFIFHLVNKPNFADFLIQTEGEMKKVSWSSKAELIGSTAVVIVTVIIMAVLIYVVDYLFISGFRLVDVLPGK